jgi:glutathione S-transferase
MLERKGIDHEVKDLLPGFHPLFLRLAGFSGNTVPALRIGGRRVQGSIPISHALEEIRPEPSLFATERDRREAIEEAERWGEREVQPVPRRIFRWGVATRPDLRRWMAREIVGMPAPNLMAGLNTPVARVFARRVDAIDAHVRSDIEQLPALLDRVDALIAEGTIGGDDPTAADFQIGTSVRVMLAFDDLAPLAAGRPASQLAMRLLPDFPGPVPAFLPAEWLSA